MTTSQLDRVNEPLVPVRVFSGPGFSAQVLTTDEILEINNGVIAATTVILPLLLGGPYTIVDGAGAAQNFPIVIKDYGGATVTTIANNNGSTTLIWDGTKWLVVFPTPVVSAVMQPFAQSNSLTLAYALLLNIRLAKTANYTVADADRGSTICLGGSAFYQLTFSAPAGYQTNFSVRVLNEDAGRAKYISISGATAFYLWPKQTVTVFKQNGIWTVEGKAPWMHPGGTLNVYTNYNSGSDVAGVTDGLDVAAPLKTANNAAYFFVDQVKFNSSASLQTRLTINMAAGVNDLDGLHLAFHDTIGAQGGAAIIFNGATQAVTGAANNGAGKIRLQVPSTANYTTGATVVVYGVGGTTEANHAYQIVVVDGTHIDLVASTFVNAFTSAGTITNGSGFATTTQDCVQTYFGTVIELQNLLFTAAGWNGINADYGSTIFIELGVQFAACTAAHMFIQRGARVNIDFTYGISGAAAQHVLTATGGTFSQQSSSGCGISNPLAFTTFAQSLSNGSQSWGGVFNLFGNAVTGLRGNAQLNGTVQSATGTPNTYFPGNSNVTAATGGQVA